jgi:hypothetical protein
MINIPTRDQIAVAVCEMVNRRDSLTNENIGVHVAGAVVAVAEMMFLQEKGNGKRNGKENENANEKENPAGKKLVWKHVKLKIWIFRQAIPHLLRNL